MDRKSGGNRSKKQEMTLQQAERTEKMLEKKINTLALRVEWCRRSIFESAKTPVLQRHFASDLRLTMQFLEKECATLSTLQRSMMIRNMRESEAHVADAVQDVVDTMPGKARTNLVRATISNINDSHRDTVDDVADDVSESSIAHADTLDEIIASVMKDPPPKTVGPGQHKKHKEAGPLPTNTAAPTAAAAAASSVAPIAPASASSGHRRSMSRSEHKADMSHLVPSPPSGFNAKPSDDEGPFGMPRSLMPKVPANTNNTNTAVSSSMAQLSLGSDANASAAAPPPPDKTTSAFECLEGL